MVLTTVMTSQLENQQSIEMENENIVEEILTEEKGNETSHPDRQPEVQDVLDSIEHVPIEYLSLIKEFNWKSIKEMMEVLFTCDCCERHQKNKPNISDLENGHRADYPPSNRKFSEDDCQCVCRQEARFFCKIINDPYINEPWYFTTKNLDSDEKSEFLEPDVGYSNIYHRDIELGCMCEDCLKEEHKEDKYENRCMECGEDMGPQNPRQLCGKTYCRNITERDDDGSIS